MNKIQIKSRTDLFGFPLTKEQNVIKRRTARKRKNIGKKFREQLDKLRLAAAE
jgi:hypothetical protein